MLIIYSLLEEHADISEVKDQELKAPKFYTKKKKENLVTIVLIYCYITVFPISYLACQTKRKENKINYR